MKNDARLLLNKKKWKNQTASRTSDIPRSGPKSAIDARKILNQKRAQNNPSTSRMVQGNSKFTKTTKGIFTNTTKGIFTKSFASKQPFVKQNVAASKVPDKRIKVTNDGNILITAKSKNGKKVPQSSQRPSFGASSSLSVSRISKSVPMQKSVHQWVPADIEMDNLEHIGINDLLDMESLPPAVTSPDIPTQNPLLLPRMQNSMVADHISASSSLSSKVVCTNLHVSVSTQDIIDLFGAVGMLKAISMPQPGSALVEFFDPLDATRAVNLYDNRLLDGQTMKCYLDTGTTPRRSSVSQRLGGRVQSVTPVASTSSFVSNPRSRYNPRDVRFTVKLT